MDFVNELFRIKYFRISIISDITELLCTGYGLLPEDAIIGWKGCAILTFR